nr:hypothetical protein BaRGS_014208 [Batillaria attramentaria]
MQEEAAYSQALLEHQRQRMRKLTEDIQDKRQLLEQLRHVVSDMEKSEIGKNSARTTFPTMFHNTPLNIPEKLGHLKFMSQSSDDIAGLCENNRRLQTDIQMYLNEIDMYRNGQTPFSIIDPMDQQNFYKNMPTGPNDLRYTKQADRSRSSPPPPPVPPPRPPPPRPPLRINSNDLTQQVPPPDRGQITQVNKDLSSKSIDICF